MKDFDDKFVFEDEEDDQELINYQGKREFTLTELCHLTGLAASTIENHIRGGHFGRKYTRLDPLPNGDKRYVFKEGAVDFFKEKRWRVEDTAAPKATKVTVEERDTKNYFYVRQYNKRQARRVSKEYAREKVQDYLYSADKFGYSVDKETLLRKYKEFYLPYYQAVIPTVTAIQKNRQEEWEIISEVDIPFNLLGDIAAHYSEEERNYFMREYVSFAASYNTEDPIQRFTIISMIDEQIRQQRLRKRILGLADYVDEEMERSLTASVQRWKILNEKLEKRVVIEKPKEEVEKKPEFKIGGGMS